MPNRFASRRARWLTATAAGLALLTSLGLLPEAAAEPPTPPTTAPTVWKQKVQPSVRQRLAAKGASDVLVRFTDRADLSRAASIQDWTQRGAYVVERLRHTADASQLDARELLDGAGATYEAYWVANLIVVKGARSELARSLAAEPEVAELAEVKTYRVPDVDPVKAATQAAAVEWGLANVHADQVWDEFGVRGDGLVIANIDTGVQFDHPDLAERYRGRQADGTYVHDYSWYDPSQVCASPAPCDNIGHGTHTMGTMVGGDASGSSIGVAPGARWIAAKGCEDEARGCTLGALLAAGQWTLAPTRLDGSGARADLRPQIVNNSWGADNGPIEEDFYNEILAAWEASGMFATFSNGNFGTKGCDSGGSPADVGTAYGVGAYDANNAIAVFSSRGPGEGGQVKPDISAPGVSVRSSVPGNTYANYSGTSMAAPHVSGTVALMWSAAPALIGDLDATRELLAQTAIDAPDLSCGGTAEFNNVFGEGRLDARAAVVASPRGQTGVLTGTVTDTATGTPVANAAVKLAGPAYERSTTTGADGRFQAAVVAGTYEISVTAYGFRPFTVGGTAVGGGETVKRDLALTKVPMARVSGTVTDGSGQGWPLAATLTVEGVPDGVFHTDPATGRYSFQLPRENRYAVEIRADYPGYVARRGEFDIGTRDLVTPYKLVTDPTECDAPGYRTVHQGLFEPFDGGASPAGWSETHEVGDGWEFGDPGERTNLTGGTGAFASIDSAAGKLLEKGFLTTPAIDLSAQEDPVLAFRTDFPYRAGARGSAKVELSVDGGQTWKDVWNRASVLRGPYLVEIPLTEAAGVADARVRFGYDSGWTYDGWWQVDDVLVGAKTCQALPGGLVVGHATDDRTRKPVGDTTVQSRLDATLTATTNDAGFYWLFSGRTGRQAFTASNTYGQYGSDDRTVRVSAHRVTKADFALGTGELRVSRSAIDEDVRAGDRRSVSLTVKNVGTAPATFQLTEHVDSLGQAGLAALQRQGAPLRRFPNTDKGNRLDWPGKVTKTTAKAAGAEWTQLPSMPVENIDQVTAVHDGKLYAVGGFSTQPNSQAHYVYDLQAQTWSTIARTTVSREKSTGGFIDGKLYAVGGWSWDGETATTQIYDPATNTWSFGADAPVKFAAAASVVLNGRLYVIGGRTDRDPEHASTHVLVYNPKTNSWSRAADYPEPISWQACGVLDGLIYCAGGQDGGERHKRTAYAYSAAANRWFRLADMPTTVWGAGYTAANGRLLVSGGIVGGYRSNQGFSYDPATNQWDTLPNSLFSLYRVSSACGFYKVGGSEGTYGNKPFVEQLPGFDQCDSPANQVPWLSSNVGTRTLWPGQQARITVTLDARQLRSPGTYTARLLLHEDTRFEGRQLPVTMEVKRRRH